MAPICLIVAGLVTATLPDKAFTLAWTHSVQKTRWEERYLASGSKLVLESARIQSSGAGMEAPPDAVLRDGWWTWQPQRVVPALRLVRYAVGRGSDYSLCWGGACRDLRALVGAANDAQTVTVRPCSVHDAYRRPARHPP